MTLVLAMIYLDLTWKAQATKAKINKWDYLEQKLFGTAEQTVNKIRRQSMEWEEIYPNYLSDKELVFKIYQVLIKLNGKKSQISLFKNGQRNWTDIVGK